VLELLRREAEFQRRAGQHYEHGGGSGGGGVNGLFRRATSQRERLTDLHRSVDQQGKSVKEAIKWAWSRWFHVSGIPGRNANNPYFISAVKQT
jgi:hypothetical protein